MTVSLLDPTLCSFLAELSRPLVPTTSWPSGLSEGPPRWQAALGRGRVWTEEEVSSNSPPPTSVH